MKQILKKIMEIFQGVYGINTLMNMIFAIFFILLGANAIFLKDKLPVELIKINICMVILGIGFFLAAIRNLKNPIIDILLEYFSMLLLGVNAHLAFIGINDHADPISLAIFSLVLLGIKIGNSKHGINNQDN